MFSIMSFVSSSKPLLFKEICPERILKEMVNFLLLYPSFTELSIILVHSVNPTLNYYIHYPKAQTFLNKRFPDVQGDIYRYILVMYNISLFYFQNQYSCPPPTRNENP